MHFLYDGDELADVKRRAVDDAAGYLADSKEGPGIHHADVIDVSLQGHQKLDIAFSHFEYLDTGAAYRLNAGNAEIGYAFILFFYQ